VTPRHLGAYLDEFVFRSNRRHNLAVGFGTLLDLGAMREPTTNDTITGSGTSRGSSARELYASSKRSHSSTRCSSTAPCSGSGARADAPG